ncbi:hypothetical protein P7C70_g669, partial [Phenoliferia sp. Uapishka_3]
MGKRELSPTSEAPSYYPEAGPAPKKGKRANPGDDERQPPEARQAIYKKKCPKERYDRVITQKFFCVERERKGETHENFKVLGSTGNIYEVKIKHLPSCNCPDGAKGNHCKHIALLTTELEAIFSNAPRDRTDIKEEKIREAYAIATGKKAAPLPGESSAGVQKRLPGDDDSCPVCYEDYTPGQEKGLVFCTGSIDSCGNGIHAECHAQWAAKTNPVTCVFCRAPWASATPAGPVAGPSYSAEGYLNMAAQANVSTYRDTSSYWQGLGSEAASAQVDVGLYEVVPQRQQTPTPKAPFHSSPRRRPSCVHRPPTSATFLITCLTHTTPSTSSSRHQNCSSSPPRPIPISLRRHMPAAYNTSSARETHQSPSRLAGEEDVNMTEGGTMDSDSSSSKLSPSAEASVAPNVLPASSTKTSKPQGQFVTKLYA